MEHYTHTCISPGCGTQYQDTDPDPYYCQPHRDQKKQLAAEIDAKRAAEGPRAPVMSDLQRYDQAPKVRGFVSAADL